MYCQNIADQNNQVQDLLTPWDTIKLKVENDKIVIL